MGRTLTAAIGIASVLLTLTAGAARAGGEARVLDGSGRVLTVGNWKTVRLDGGMLRVPHDLVLSFELRSPTGSLVAEGVVPGTVDDLLDGPPVLSRNPANGELVTVWSRESAAGHREVVSLAYGSQGFVGQPRVLAGSSSHEAVEPDLIHDREGNAYVAWRETGSDSAIQLLALDRDGVEIFRRQVSTTDTILNGAPRLGVDATGSLFVAYLGLEASSGTEPLLRVHAANPQGGGVIHVPNPIIELGRVTDLSVAQAVPAPQSSAWTAPRLNVAILGGTPVIWWLSEDDRGRLLLNHAIRTPEGEWDELPLGRIALATLGDPQAAVRDALAMIESRYRSVISLVSPGAPAPVLGPNDQLSMPGLSLRRR